MQVCVLTAVLGFRGSCLDLCRVGAKPMLFLYSNRLLSCERPILMGFLHVFVIIAPGAVTGRRQPVASET
jgi:hypothetical protein